MLVSSKRPEESVDCLQWREETARVEKANADVKNTRSAERRSRMAQSLVTKTHREQFALGVSAVPALTGLAAAAPYGVRLGVLMWGGTPDSAATLGDISQGAIAICGGIGTYLSARKERCLTKEEADRIDAQMVADLGELVLEPYPEGDPCNELSVGHKSGLAPKPKSKAQIARDLHRKELRDTTHGAGKKVKGKKTPLQNREAKEKRKMQEKRMIRFSL